nr:hypothetical protein [Bacillus pumilus]
MKLAITGKLGAGKDEAVKYLVAMYEFFPFTFSAKGKSVFGDLFRIRRRRKTASAYA